MEHIHNLFLSLSVIILYHGEETAVYENKKGEQN
jgi:hypothetical protein